MTTKRTDRGRRRRGGMEARASQQRAHADRERAALDLWAELTSLTGTVRTQLAERLEAELGMLPDEADLLVLLARGARAAPAHGRRQRVAAAQQERRHAPGRQALRARPRACARPAPATGASCTRGSRTRAGRRRRPRPRPVRPAWRSCSPAASHPRNSTSLTASLRGHARRRLVAARTSPRTAAAAGPDRPASPFIPTHPEQHHGDQTRPPAGPPAARPAAARPGHRHRPRPPQGLRPRPRARVLPGRARLRAHRPARRPGRLRLRRRLPPPHRPQHVGVARRLSAAARRRPASTTWRSAIRRARRWRARCAR